MSTMRQALWHAVDLANARGQPVYIVAIRSLPRYDADGALVGGDLDDPDNPVYAVQVVEPDHHEWIRVNPGGRLPDNYLEGGEP